MKGKSTTNKTNALAICSFELKFNLSYSQNRIAFVLNKHDSVISKYIKRISFLDSNYAEDAKLIDKKRQIREKIIEFKNNVINK